MQKVTQLLTKCVNDVWESYFKHKNEKQKSKTHKKKKKKLTTLSNLNS